MSKRTHAPAVGAAIVREQKQLRRERLLSNPGLIFGAVVFAMIVLCALIIPAVSPVDPNATNVPQRLQPPSLEHLFGTDEFGRDLFTRVLYGARSSLLVGGAVAVFSCLLGAAEFSATKRR